MVRRRATVHDPIEILAVVRILELVRFWPKDGEIHRMKALYPNAYAAARRVAPELFNGNTDRTWVYNFDGDCIGCGRDLTCCHPTMQNGHTDHDAEDCASESLEKCEICKTRHCPHCRRGCTCPGDSTVHREWSRKMMDEAKAVIL